MAENASEGNASALLICDQEISIINSLKSISVSLAGLAGKSWNDCSYNIWRPPEVKANPAQEGVFEHLLQSGEPTQFDPMNQAPQGLCRYQTPNLAKLHSNDSP